MEEHSKIVVYGNFLFSKPGYGGQITKTRNVFNCLVEKYGKENVVMFNIEGWTRTPFKMFFSLLKHLKLYKNFVILPGDNNLKFLLIFLKRYIKKYNINIYYMVVGGWLYDYLKNKKSKTKILSLFTGIFVETKELLFNLDKINLKNVYYSPVFSLRNIREKQLILEDIENLKLEKNLKFCTFSRVLKEKGIGLTVGAIKSARLKGIECTLDIYGAVDKTYVNEFNELLSLNKDYVNYLGFIDDDEVIKVLAKYHFMIFATYYYGEGFPATLLEAYMAGLPILASDWKYNKEIVRDNETGFLFAPKDENAILDCITKVSNKKDIYSMRLKAQSLAYNFSPERALEPLFLSLDKYL